MAAVALLLGAAASAGLAEATAPATAITPKAATAAATAAAVPVDLAALDRWAAAGEMVTMRVDALGLEAGLVRFGVTDRFEVEGRPHANLAADSRARGAWAALHPLVDELYTRFDLGERRPVHTVARYGDPGRRLDVRIDHGRAAPIPTRVVLQREGTKPRGWTHPWRAAAHDPLSALYAVRARRWALGDEERAFVYVGWELYDVTVRATRKEPIATAFGVRAAIVLEVKAVLTPNPRVAVRKRPAATVLPGAKGVGKDIAKGAAKGAAATALPGAKKARPGVLPSPKLSAVPRPAPPTVHAITIWLSDDEARVPLEAKATYEGLPLHALLDEYAAFAAR